jgi:hypothetical protein
METKLTLKLDKSIIQSVKVYAENHNRSLSKLVEDYFRKLITEPEQSTGNYSALVKELSGVISEEDLAKTHYVDYVEKKYE